MKKISMLFCWEIPARLQKGITELALSLDGSNHKQEAAKIFVRDTKHVAA
jgi:hypothetical protein